MSINGAGGFVPQVFRAADLAGTVASAAPAPAASGGFQLGDIEKIFEFLDKFLPRMKQFEATISNLKAMDKQTNEAPAPVGTDSYEGHPVPVTVLPGQTIRIDPQKAYAKLLGALAKLAEVDPDMTVTAALDKARNYKELILPEIDSALRELQDEHS